MIDMTNQCSPDSIQSFCFSFDTIVNDFLEFVRIDMFENDRELVTLGKWDKKVSQIFDKLLRVRHFLNQTIALIPIRPNNSDYDRTYHQSGGRPYTHQNVMVLNLEGFKTTIEDLIHRMLTRRETIDSRVRDLIEAEIDGPKQQYMLDLLSVVEEPNFHSYILLMDSHYYMTSIFDNGNDILPIKELL